MKSHSLIRTIYLYVFALLGLVLLTIGSVRFVDMGLRSFVFTLADEERRLEYKRPPIYYPVERLEKVQAGEEGLSEQEKGEIRRMIQNYKQWEEQRQDIDPITSRRHRDASTNLALILIGLPLYLYHWGVIKKETKK
ncbi:hypothetical protein MYX07_03890 [Patescibacteria group bacterium AH-259-L07]|nr:hypothetical protein [Patescibacteria group bacterium AH-259-L07]